MTRERASIFASDDAFDVSAFAPKAAHELNGASAELVRGDRVGFTIREPRGEGELAGERCPPWRGARLGSIALAGRCSLTPGRNHRPSRPSTIADRQGWLVGETLEHALAALQRELAGQGPVEA